MCGLFERKYIQYNLCRYNLLKLPSTKTYQRGTLALFFKGSLLWNKVPDEFKKLKTLDEFGALPLGHVNFARNTFIIFTISFFYMGVLLAFISYEL